MTTDETPAAINKMFRLEDELLSAREEIQRITADRDQARSIAVRLEQETADMSKYITSARLIRAALGDWIEDVDHHLANPTRPIGEAHDLHKMRRQLIRMRETLVRPVLGYDEEVSDV